MLLKISHLWATFDLKAHAASIRRASLFFAKYNGFSNPYYHLKSSLSAGDEDHFLTIYKEAPQDNQKSGWRFRSQSRIIMKLTNLEKSMYAYMRLIVFKSAPLRYIADPEIREFSKHEDVFSITHFKETLFKLLEIVEESIRGELKGIMGALMQDGWTNNATHYVAFIHLTIAPLNLS